jgi:hypothetical protein
MLALEFVGFLAEHLQSLVLVVVTEKEVRFVNVINQALQAFPIFNRPAVNHSS